MIICELGYKVGGEVTVNSKQAVLHRHSIILSHALCVDHSSMSAALGATQDEGTCLHSLA